jgi:hypothetical protein
VPARTLVTRVRTQWLQRHTDCTVVAVMRHHMSRAIAALALAATIATSGCAYTLHPERRGNSGGDVSGSMLACDLLWLIPGIIPGVVFLIVDFTSGAMYRPPSMYQAYRVGATTPVPSAPARSTPAADHR